MVDGLSPATLVATGALIAACSGIPGVLFRQAPGTSRIASVIAILAASAFGLTGSFIALTSPPNQTAAPSFATLMVDPLSACFLIPLFIVSSCCAVYSIGYWPADTIKNSAVTTFFFGLLIGAIALVITARTALVFLGAWEVMALGAFFSLSAEHEKAEVRKAGRLYLITSHTATLALFAMFALLKIAGNSAAFPLTASLAGSTPLAAAIFVTGLFGFGVKAGIMPLHIWLPSAHAGAPSHISALMSGVLIKTGIYGIIRITSFFIDIPLWWGTTVILLGIASAVAGVAFAIGQHDLKRLLAYHSIENIGIIVMGIGMALIGVSTDMPVLTLLGMAGALLHVINHALFKSLLFLCAGSVVHATGTREIDLLGGLSKKMPRTAGLFLLGSVAICGLPPLNGFVSEFLLYIGFFNGIRSVSPLAAAATAVAAPSLALVGGLAVACFVKVYGATFLGFPRTESIQSPHEAGHVMVVPMAFLGLLCVAIGVFPTRILGILQPAVASWRPGIAPDIAVHAPVAWISLAAGVLLTLILVLFFLVRRKTANAPRTVTWDCGYLRPAASMQYTSSSFAEMIVKLFAGILRPERHDPAVKGLFPKPAKFSSHVPEAVMEVVLQPAWHRLQTLLGLVRHLQHGQIPLYILYIFVTLVCLLVWGAALTPGTNFGG